MPLPACAHRRHRSPLLPTAPHRPPTTLPPAQSAVVSGSRDNSVRAWDLRTGRPRLHLTQHFGGVQCLAFDDKLGGGNGGYLSGARDSTINVWARSGHFLRTLRSHKGLVNSMAVRQNEGKNGESRVASGSSDGCRNPRQRLRPHPPRLPPTQAATARAQAAAPPTQAATPPT